MWALVFVLISFPDGTMKAFFHLVELSLFGLSVLYLATVIFIAVFTLMLFQLWRRFERQGQGIVNNNNNDDPPCNQSSSRNNYVGLISTWKR